MSEIKYTEMFGGSGDAARSGTFQGEGIYTGRQSVFLRLAGCTLNCAGFSQPDPADPSTYVQSVIFQDPKMYKTLDDLPIITTGCDSAYSVSSKFKHLFKSDTAENIANELTRLAGGKWITSKNNDIHLVITGGEPMLWQDGIIDIVETLIDSGEFPRYITIETNGTKPISDVLSNFIHDITSEFDIEWLWSISPKLKNVSGEVDAIHPEIWDDYFATSMSGYFKFVMTNSEAAWAELDEISQQIHDHHEWSSMHEQYVMPVGSSKEQQEDSNVIEKIVVRALKEGYQISGRLHSVIFQNQVGT